MKLDPSNKCLPAGRAMMVAVVLYVAIPNFIFWIAVGALRIDRPFVDIDYLFAGALFAFGWRKTASLLLLMFLVADVLVLQGLVYPVLRLPDVIYLLSLFPYAAPVWQGAAAGLSLLLLSIVGVSYWFGKKWFKPRASRLAALALFGLAVSAYAIQNHLDEMSSDFYRVKSALLGSQSAYLVNMNAVSFFDDYYEDKDVLVRRGFDERVAGWMGDEGPSSKILVIVVESWGVMKDERLQEALLEPVFANRAYFDWVETRHIPGDVATLAAELRILCGLGTRYFNLKPVTEGFEGCLPWHLKGKGYKTTAVHGAVGAMYDRQHWYPRVGFDEVHFRDTDTWKTRCYSFPGVCDSEIMETVIPDAFGQEEKRLVYWLTLNTHTRYDRRDISRDTLDCKAHGLDDGGEICLMNKLHAQFFHQLAEVLLTPAMRGVEVLLAGDHSPPILDRGEYRKHVVDGKVTLLHLRVKEGMN